MKKLTLIFPFLVLVLIFGIGNVVFAAFDKDKAPALVSPADGAIGLPLGPLFQWQDNGVDADSYEIKIWGPGIKIKDCIHVNAVCPVCNTYPGSTGGGPTAVGNMEYQLPAGTLYNSQFGCTYYWRARGWENCNNQGEHSQWSTVWSFTTVGTGNPNDKCPATPIEGGRVNECCFLDHDLTEVDPVCEKGEIVGPANPQWCDVNDDGTMDIIPPGNVTIRWGTCCLLDTVYNISDWIFTFFFPVIIIVFVIAAYFFLFSGGEPQRLQKAKNILLWGIAGFILLVFAKLIPFVIKSIIS